MMYAGTPDDIIVNSGRLPLTFPS